MGQFSVIDVVLTF